MQLYTVPIIKHMHSSDQMEDGTQTQTQFSVWNKSNNRISYMLLKSQSKQLKFYTSGNEEHFESEMYFKNIFIGYCVTKVISVCGHTSKMFLMVS